MTRHYRCKAFKTILAWLLISSTAFGQSIDEDIPRPIQKSANYLFYLHGGVVTALGDNAVNQSVPEWGPYEYSNILDSLRSRGFNVISENRREGIDDSVYVDKIVKQIDTLLKADVDATRILLVGASAGSNIVIRTSANVQNKNLKYVIMGGCWPDTYKQYKDLPLTGHFLSIIEITDPHGTCYRIFEHRKGISSYHELKLNTGLSHGFIYKGHKEWIDPILLWFKKLD